MKGFDKNDVIILMDRVQGIEEIASSVAHEVRNPMAVVSSSLKMMELNEDLVAYCSQFQSMAQEIDRAMQLLGEFIQITRPKVFELRLGNLNNIIESIQVLLNADAKVHHHTIMYDLEPLEDVLVDSKRFCQVILNLVRNALEAMCQPPKKIMLRTFMERGRVCLAVSDQGSGFAPNILENLGKPFITTKTNGSGLGLAACKNIVEHHHAQMEVRSDEGGATVQIAFEPYNAYEWFERQNALASAIS